MTIKEQLHQIIDEFKFSTRNKQTKSLMKSRFTEVGIRPLMDEIYKFYLYAHTQIESGGYTMLHKSTLEREELLSNLVSFEVAKEIIDFLETHCNEARLKPLLSLTTLTIQGYIPYYEESDQLSSLVLKYTISNSKMTKEEFHEELEDIAANTIQPTQALKMLIYHLGKSV